MSNWLQLTKAKDNGPNVKKNNDYFIYQGGYGKYDPANIENFKMKMNMIREELHYDLVNEEIGAKDKKTGITWNKSKELESAHEKTARFFLQTLHHMMWRHEGDPVTYDKEGYPTDAVLDWTRGKRSSIDLLNALPLLEELMKSFIVVQSEIIESKYGAKLNAAVVYKKLLDIKNDISFGMNLESKK